LQGRSGNDYAPAVMTYCDHIFDSLLSSLIDRREALAALVSAAALPVLAACNREPSQPSKTPAGEPTEADALALLDDVANNLLRLSPESATSPES